MTGSPPSPPFRRFERWAEWPALVVFAIYFFGQPQAIVDDAFIFYRYAENLAAGLGPVYNLGERVEGFSSVLWTVLLAIGARLGVSPETFGPALGFVLGAGIVLLAGRLARRTFPNAPWMWFLVPLGVSLSAGHVFYSAAGMDTTLFSFVLLGATLSTAEIVEHGRFSRWGAWLAALVFVRAEGPAYAALLVLCAAILPPKPRSQQWRRAFRIGAGIAALACIVLLAGRFLIFQELLPASMRSKSILSHTLSEVLHGRETFQEFRRLLARGVKYEAVRLLLLVPPLLVLGLRAFRGVRIPRSILVYGAVVLASIAVSVWAVGDWMPHTRASVPTWPLMLVLLAWSGRAFVGAIVRPRSGGSQPSIAGTLATRLASALAVALALLGIGIGMEGLPRISNPFALRVFRTNEFDRYQSEVGEALGAMEPAPTVAANMVGQLAYRGGRQLYVRDVLGLTDAHNAKHGEEWVPTYGRTDPAYSFGPPLDVVFTTTGRDLIDLYKVAPDSQSVAKFVLCADPEWLERRFFILVRASAPARAVLRELSKGPEIPFDSATVAIVRGFELTSSEWPLPDLARVLDRAHAGPAAPSAVKPWR